MTRRPSFSHLPAVPWLLRRLLQPARVEEVEGDLEELWTARATARAGWMALRLAYLRDVAGVISAALAAERLRRRMSATAHSPHKAGTGIFGMGQDVRHVLRLIRRQPLFAVVTVSTLALGIAASAGIFTAVDRLLLRPLPYPAPERLVTIENPPYSFARGRMDLSPRVARSGLFTAAGLYAEGGLNIDTGNASIRVPAAVASPGVFAALGVAPQLGRWYTDEEDKDGANTVAVISDGLWSRHLGRDPATLHRPLQINGRAFRVVGVMPGGFQFPGRTDVWIPPFSDRQITGQAFFAHVVGRLAPGVSPAAATDALIRLNADRGAPAGEAQQPGVVPLHDELTARVRSTLLLLALSIGLVLLVTCSNVAGLMLSRVARRHSEFVLRRALGGSRWRLARLLLLESLMLSLAAGAVGIAGATVALRSIAAFAADPVPGVDLSTVDVRMVGIVLGLSMVTALLFSLAPAAAAASQEAALVIRASATATGSRTWRLFRHALVIGQVAAALVLLTVSGAALTTLGRLSRVDLGFLPGSALAFDVSLPLARYGSPSTAIDFYDRAHDALTSVPGVARVAATGMLPGDTATGVGVRVERFGQPSDPSRPPTSATLLSATPDYFSVMGIAVARGRAFTAADRAGAPKVVILSESTAAALWPDGRDPVGQRITVTLGKPAEAAVVGVVADVLLRGPAWDGPARQLYHPLAQQPPYGTMSFVLDIDARERSTGIPATAVREAIGRIDPSLPIYNLRPTATITSGFLAAHRLAATTLAAFATMTLALAAVGLYGSLAQLVTHQRREIGIRIALGADHARIRRGVVALGAKLAVVGLATGLPIAGVAAKLIGTFVPSLDPPSSALMMLASVVLLGAAITASWLPARRATQGDPLLAMRAE